MRLSVTIPYMHCEARSGVYRYRRRVPSDLVRLVGKKKLDISLKTKDAAEAILRGQKQHSATEAEWARLRARGLDQVAYEVQRSEMRGLGLMAGNQPSAGPLADAGQKVSEAAWGALSAFGPVTPDSKAGREKVRMAEALVLGVNPPQPRLARAVEVYLEERGGNNLGDLTKQVGVAVRALEAAMGKVNPVVTDIGHLDAYAMRNGLLARGQSPATVRKRIGTIKTVLNVAKGRLNLTDWENPFLKLTLPKGVKEVAAKDQRDPLTVDEIWRCRAALAGYNPQIRAIWDLMTLTGARLGEICQLHSGDVFLEQAPPFIWIRARVEGQSLKSSGSTRRVPLAAGAVSVLRGVLDAGEGSIRSVFTKYAGASGSNSASALLIKAMKAAGVWRERVKVPYSLRHSHKDWIRAVAPDDIRQRMHGHGNLAIEDRYGNTDFLERLAKALDEALLGAGMSAYPEAR